ncbi:MAG: DUF883 family protein [Kiritimatiellia bacterium]|jgi:ElaB/YqjD/DUF883 family membrane-anchored ribosome-binding protein
MSDTITDQEEKIAEALDTLEQTCKEKKEVISEMLSSKYANLRETLIDAGKASGAAAGEVAARTREALANAYDVGQEKIKRAAGAVDSQVHATPWPFVGGVALVSLMFGYILGRTR